MKGVGPGTQEAGAVPVVAFFNTKGGVGRASLVYHTSWMLSELGVRTLAVDLDPQASLTAAFLDEGALERLWEDRSAAPTTIYRCVQPGLHGGDVQRPQVVGVTPDLALLPGDLDLASFEDELAAQWAKSLGGADLAPAFRVLTALWRAAQMAARDTGAAVILLDVGPTIGPLNRAALVASDFVVVPLTADVISIQGLRALGVPAPCAGLAGWSSRAARSPRPRVPGAGEAVPQLDADGAVGSHAAAVQSAYRDFSDLARKLLDRIGVQL